MCKNFFLSPRSRICSECLFSLPSASGAPRLCRPVPQGSRSQACRVGRAAPSGSAPGSRPSRRPAVPLGWPEPQRDTPWGSKASRRAVRPQSRFQLPEVSGFHTRGAASPSAPPSASLAFSRALALGELRAPAGASAAGHARLCVCGALPWSRGAGRRSQRPATLCAGSYLSVSFPTPASTGARRRCRCAVDASRLLDA